ncbi:MAG: hypothetical protein K2O52_05820, partial [Oscillospiraceae bacterium]|nr:hypothetical protein [Oscillospiraceae bacterium]
GKVISNIKMLDMEAGKVAIGKQDATNGEEIKGALLTITKKADSISDITMKGRNFAKSLTEENKYTAYTIENGVLKFYSSEEPDAISGLTDGEYTLEEENAPEGYLISKETAIFTIKDGKVSGKTFITDNPINVTISKYDIVNSKELENATLTIKGDKLQKAVNVIYALDENGKSVELISNEEDSTSVSYKTTGKKVTIYGLPAGAYTLTEESAPEGYEVAEEIKFTIDETGKVSSDELDADGVIVMEDDIITEAVQVTISKKDAASGKELAGAKLTVTYTGTEDISLEDIVTIKGGATEKEINGKSITFKSGTTQTILENLPAGTYTLTEDTAPLGYTTATQVTFTVNEDGTVTSGTETLDKNRVTLTDKLIELQIDKVEIAGTGTQELAGAELTIKRTNDDDVTLNGVTVTRGGKEIDVKDRTNNTITFISGEETTILSKLPAGNYTLEEIATPDNTVYQIAETISFTVGKDGKLSKVQDAYSYEEVENKDGKVLSNITMLDTKDEVIISKVDSKTDEGIKGALLAITKLDDENGVSDEITLIGKVERTKVDSLADITDANRYAVYTIEDGILKFYSNNASICISGLPAGKYEISELSAPEGYIKDAVAKEFEISNTEELKNRLPVEIQNKAINVTISKWDIANSEELADATLTIKGDNLKKAVNAIYALDEDNESVDLVIAEDLTSISYKTTGKKVTIYGLPAGDYTLTEESAPEGYTVAEEIKFTIETTGKVKSDDLDADGAIVMNDDVITEKVQVAISKKDAASGNELAGAKLTVTNNEGTSLENVEVIGGGATSAEKKGASITFISGNRETTLRDLPAGTYTLTEDTAPLGYTTASKATFTVNEDGTVSAKRVTLTDKVIELTIDKVEIAGEGTKELAGAELTITNTDGTSLEKVVVSGGAKDITQKDASITFTSGEETAVFSKLPAGNYTLTEIATPDNTVYQIAETINFTIGKDGKLTKVQKAYSYETDIENQDGTVLSNITMLDTKDEVMISKIDADTNMGVKGALLAITKLDDENGVSDEITVWGRVTRTQIDSLANITEENKYTVYAIEDGVLKFYTNNVNIYIDGLPAGKYTITELSAPEGYIGDALTQEFEISNTEESGNKPSIEIKNTAMNVTISKWDIANSKELENATLTIKGDNLKKAENAIYALDEDGETVNLVIAEDSSISYQTTGKKVTIYGLPAGDYVLTEESAPEGYTVAEEIKFTINEKGKVKSDDLDADGAIVMNDDVITEKVQVAISKKDAASGNELAGAKLTVTNNEGTSLENVEVIGGGATSAEKKGASITFISGNRETTLRDLPAGTYTLTEDTAPLGYTTASKVTFTVNEDGTVSSKKVVLTDKVIELTIDKVEIAGTGTKELAGAKLTITNTDGTSLEKVTVSGGTKDVEQKDASITFISGEEATVLSKLPAGNYTLTEIATPDNEVYQVAEVISFTIGKDGKLSKVQNEYSFETGSEEDGKMISNITMLDTKLGEIVISKQDATTKNEVEGALLKITKTDDENGISNDVSVYGFRIPREKVDSLADITAINQSFVYTIENGVLMFYTAGYGNTLVSGLTDGTYELAEVVAPDGYLLATGTVEFAIKDGKVVDGNTVIEIEDEPITITISKWDIANSKELAGATLTIASKALDTVANEVYLIDEDGEEVEIEWNEVGFSYVTTGKKVTISGLPAGSYTLTEETAPDGYEIAELIEFTIDKNGNVKSEAIDKDGVIVMNDDIITEVAKPISISKRAVGGTAELAGATLVLTLTEADDKNATLAQTEDAGLSEDKMSITWTSSNTAKEISNLPDGTYTLKETGANFVSGEKTYKIINSVLTFTIKDGVITTKVGKFEDETSGGSYAITNKNKIVVNDAEEEIIPTETTTTTTETTTTSTTTKTETTSTSTTTKTETTTTSTTTKTETTTTSTT